jgi:hypothetical protein
MCNTNAALEDLQFSSILNSLTNLPLEDPDKSLQQAIFLKDRATWRHHHKTTCDTFWLHPRFCSWAESPSSALIMVHGRVSGRAAMRTCLVNAIEQIRLANATALWALKTGDAAGSSSSTPISTVDMIKYLTAQALRFGPAPTERSLALSCARLQSARGEKEWVNLLAAGLADLKRVFIVVDVELLSREVACSPQEGFTLPSPWPSSLRSLRRGLRVWLSRSCWPVTGRRCSARRVRRPGKTCCWLERPRPSGRWRAELEGEHRAWVRVGVVSCGVGLALPRERRVD